MRQTSLLGAWVIALALFYVLGQGFTMRLDEAVPLAEARALIERHSFDLQGATGLPADMLAPGMLGHVFAADPPGAALLLAPWVAVGLAAAEELQLDPNQTDGLALVAARAGSALAMACAVILVYLLALNCNVSRSAALVAAICLGLASQAWPLALVATKVPWACLAAALVVYNLHRILSNDSGAHDFLGLGLGCGLLLLLDLRLALLPGVALLALLLGGRRTLGQPAALLLMVLTFALVGSILPMLNLIHFGQPFPRELIPYTGHPLAALGLLLGATPDAALLERLNADPDAAGRFRGLLLAAPLALLALLCAPLYLFGSKRALRALLLVAAAFVAGLLGVAGSVAPWRIDGWDLGLLWPVVLPAFGLIGPLFEAAVLKPPRPWLRHASLGLFSFVAAIGLVETLRCLLLGRLGLAALDLPLGLLKYTAPETLEGLGLLGLLAMLASNLEGALLALPLLITAAVLLFLLVALIDLAFAPRFDLDEYVASRTQE